MHQLDAPSLTVGILNSRVVLYAIASLMQSIVHIIVGDPGTGGQAEAHLEYGLLNAVGVNLGIGIDGLLVHGFPHRAALHFLLHLSCI